MLTEIILGLFMEKQLHILLFNLDMLSSGILCWLLVVRVQLQGGNWFSTLCPHCSVLVP